MICNSKYIISKEITVVFRNVSNYYYQFVIKEIIEGFKGQFACSGKNTEKIHFQFQ